MWPRLLLTINWKFAVDFFARGLHTRTAVARLPLRQLGFLVINDIDVDIVNKLLKFADDTKIAAVVSDKDGVDQLHMAEMDLVNLYKWSCDWQMLFTVDKCKVLHFGGKIWIVDVCIHLVPVLYKKLSYRLETGRQQRISL